jgi:subtilisin family serine protease
MRVQTFGEAWMRIRKWMWLVFLGGLTPLYFNCQKHVDHKGRDLSRSTLTDTSADDDHLVHKFSALSEKVELDSATLKLAAASGNEIVVPEGLPLFVLVDHECISARASEIVSGQRKASPVPPMSEKAARESKTKRVDSLRYQAYGIRNTKARSLGQLVSEADADECVLHVANDFRISVHPISLSLVTNDPGFGVQRHHIPLKSSQAWDVFLSPGRGIRRDVNVAVVDSGIDHGHRDLADNMWRGGAGLGGIDLANGDNNPMDDNGHGTHVAGLIGAVANNGLGVTGVMGRNVRLMGVKVFDADGSGAVSTVVNGIRWSADNGADVINLSMELPSTSIAIRDAMNYASGKGAVIVAAAGNSGNPLSPTFFVSPAAYATQVNGVLAVASTDVSGGRRSNFSNYSNTLVQISAPGSEDSVSRTGLMSTFPRDAEGRSLYGRSEGTSMAAPLVAGAAALVIGMLKTEGLIPSNATVTSLIRSSSRSNPDLLPEVQSGAALDLDRLGRTVKWRYLIENDAGTESPF